MSNDNSSWCSVVFWGGHALQDKTPCVSLLLYYFTPLGDAGLNHHHARQTHEKHIPKSDYAKNRRNSSTEWIWVQTEKEGIQLQTVLGTEQIQFPTGTEQVRFVSVKVERPQRSRHVITVMWYCHMTMQCQTPSWRNPPPLSSGLNTPPHTQADPLSGLPPSPQAGGHPRGVLHDDNDADMTPWGCFNFVALGLKNSNWASTKSRQNSV